MIYEIYVSGYASVPSDTKKVTCTTKEEAEAIAKNMQISLERQLTKVSWSSRIQESDDNYTYIRGAIYLVKMWSKYYPAVCEESHRHYGRKAYEHKFRFLKSRNVKYVYGKFPPRVGKKLCDDRKIGQEACGLCPAKFICYTNSLTSSK